MYRATSQDPGKYSNEQAWSNSIDLDQMTYLKEPFDLDPHWLPFPSQN